MLGAGGILLSLVLLMYFAYRGVSVVVLAPVLALLAVGLDGTLPILPTYTHLYMKSLGAFVTSYFPLFLSGALFGKLMDTTGCAETLVQFLGRCVGSQHAVGAVILSCAILTYGGVSLFVVAFAVYPMARTAFSNAQIPARLIPATIALGSFTFTMTALPGSTQIQNIIPTKYFGTTIYAAPTAGLLASAIMLLGGWSWLAWRSRTRTDVLPSESPGIPRSDVSASAAQIGTPWVALLPIATVLLLNYFLSEWMIPHWELAPLASTPLGPIQMQDVRGIWSTLASVTCANLILLGIVVQQKGSVSDVLRDGAHSAFLPLFNTASEVGYGMTIAKLAGFDAIRQALLAAPGSVLVSEAIAVNLLAGITGSASGGLSIALEALGATYLARATEHGIGPELLHRVAAISCGGLDTLPHNGAVITLLGICGMTHRESYGDMAFVSVVMPMVATAVVIAAASYLPFG